MAGRARLNESRVLIVNLGGQGWSVLPNARDLLLFPQKRGKHFGHITNPLQYNTVNLFKMES